MKRRLGRAGIGFAGVLAVAALLLLPAGAEALTIVQIGGTDAETQYTGFLGPGPPAGGTAGVLTFYDSFNGFNAPEHGTVTTSAQLPSFLGAEVRFEAMLDTSAFDPATGDVRSATFIGTGAAPEMTFWSGSTLLLALDLNFIIVTQAAKGPGALGGPTGTILLGDPTLATFGVTSQLTVAGGSLNAAVGGIGAQAVLEILMSSLDPTMTKALRNSGYLNSDFTNGVGISSESTTWNLTLVPEAGSAFLLGATLLGLLSAVRRSTH